MKLTTSAPTPGSQPVPIVAGTQLVETFTDLSGFEEDWEQPGSYDQVDRLFAAALPGSSGTLVAPGGDTLEATILLAAGRARSARSGHDPFPAQAVLRDAATGAMRIVSLGGETHAGGGLVGAIDGWGYRPDTARALHPEVVAVVGGESWFDLRPGATPGRRLLSS